MSSTVGNPNIIDFDVETNGVQPYAGKEAFLYIFGDADHEEAIELRDPQDHEARARIQAWFDRATKAGGIRAWNSKFDWAFAENAGFTVPPEHMWVDEMLVAHAVDERINSKLKDRAVKLFGPQSADLQRQVHDWLTKERATRKKTSQDSGVELEEPTYADVPMEIMGPYGLEDVILTRKVAGAYDPVLDQSPDLKRVVEFEHDVLPALYAMERRGLPADEEGYRRLEVEVAKNLDPLEERVEYLAKQGGVEGEGQKIANSTKQVLTALRGRGADMSFMETNDDGEVKSANKDNLNAVDDEFAAAVLDLRSELKVLGTYVQPMIHRHYDTSLRAWKEQHICPDGRIHANYFQIGARTGRMSCLDPNMQNQPRDDLRLRYNIRAEEGMKLVTCDLTNIEMVLFAIFAGEGRLMRTLREGGDVHVLTAELLGIKDRVRAGGHVESSRQRGKTFNFSVVYGGGIPTVRRQQRCDSGTARKMRNRYFEVYPEITRLQNRVKYALYDRGYVQDKLISGRRFRCYNPKREWYKYVNYLVQGTASSVLKEAVAKLHRDGVPIVGLVHDEVLAHVPAADAEEVKHLVIKRLIENEAINEIIPLRAEGDIVDRWSQAKKPDFVPKFARG